MICKRVEYKDFRNIKDETVSFSPSTTILYGKNAQGKTNMLEGVYIFAQGKSHRAGRDSELVRFGADSARLTMTYESAGRENTLSLVIEGGRHKIPYKNGIKLDRLSEMIGNFRAVLFSPEHLAIVKAGPSERRAFLDVAISQLRPVYMRTLQRYNTILMQRNALLKSMKQNTSASLISSLEAWSEQLSEYAARVAVVRADYAEKLSELTSELYADMTGKKESVFISYHGTSRIGGDYGDEKRIREIYRRQLTENVEREIMLGSTQYGVHKDDVDIMLNDREAKFFASQGQQRSIVLTLKLAEGEYSKRETGEYPVFLLDDILSELDPARRSYVVSGIKDRQVIITSCDMSVKRRIRGGLSYCVRSGTASLMAGAKE